MQEPKPRKKRKKRMRLPNGIGSVHLIGDGKNRRNPWRARVPSHVEIDEVNGTAKQKYITVGYFPTEVDAIDALMNYRKNPFTLEASVAECRPTNICLYCRQATSVVCLFPFIKKPVR